MSKIKYGKYGIPKGVNGVLEMGKSYKDLQNGNNHFGFELTAEEAKHFSESLLETTEQKR